MSLRAADARFLLPRHPRKAVVLGDLEHWRLGLREAEIEVLGRAHIRAQPDVAIAPGSLADDAAATGAPSLVLIGKAPRRRLSDLGLDVRSFLQLPRRGDPDLFMPLGRPLLSGYVLSNIFAPTTRLKRYRNEVVQAFAARGHSLLPERLLTVATRLPGEPFLVEAAIRAGTPAAASSVLSLRRQSKRNAFYLFSEGAAAPSHVLKFTRQRGGGEALASHRRGLELVQAAGPVVMAHAPRTVGNVEQDGFVGLVETAVIGTKLARMLASSRSRAAKLEIVERIAAWCVETLRVTARPAEQLAPARTWIDSEVVRHWVGFGVPANLVDSIPAVPAVLQHRDLTSFNLIVSDGGFAAIDWEGARDAWFPIFDLVYFLADALALLDGATTEDRRLRHFSELFRGELESSRVLFRWIRHSVRALDVPPEAVGPIATLCWLYFGFAPWRTPPGVSPASLDTVKARLARSWLADPALGAGWSSWQR